MARLDRSDEYVFPTLRKYKTTWVYDRFRNALLRNGITLWPKLIHTLRANCITDYAGEGLNQVVLDSIFGNSAEIRRKHCTGNVMKLVVWSRLPAALTRPNSIIENYLNGPFGRQAIVRGNNFRPFAVYTEADLVFRSIPPKNTNALRTVPFQGK
ncbi:MAG TPA: hypothetical protein DEB39_14680 [Planctomycetaceae bacterium]|nr:hypothetical protein [Planctomycetaceae bacterium]